MGGGPTPNGENHLKFPFWLFASFPKNFFASCLSLPKLKRPLFKETWGFWRGDGQTGPSNRCRGHRRLHPPASPHRAHRQEEEVAAEVWRRKTWRPQWREPEAQNWRDVHPNKIESEEQFYKPIIHSESPVCQDNLVKKWILVVPKSWNRLLPFTVLWVTNAQQKS